MSAATNFLYGTSRTHPAIFIEEDSTPLKALACIPIIGAAVGYFQERSLAEKITQTTAVPRAIELITVKNQYKVTGIVRGLITIAWNVAGIAFRIFGVYSGAIGALLLIVNIGGIAQHAYYIYQNNQAIHELQTTTALRTEISIS